MEPTDFTILLIEDDEGDAFLIEEMLEGNNKPSFEVHWCTHLHAGLKALDEQAYSLILLDLSLPDSFGIKTFSKIFEHTADTPIIVLSHNDDEQLAMQTVQLGAQDYVAKGEVSSKGLVRAIRYAVERQMGDKALRAAHEELAQHALELELAYDEMHKVLAVKNEFLAKMSHELRTPLAAMLITTELIEMRLGEQYDPKVVQYLARIHKNGQHLLDMITDILDIARIQNSQIAIETAPTSIQEVCQDSLRIVEPFLAEKDLDLIVSIPAGLPYVITDKRRLKQILINLLSNAIKFTDSPGKVGLNVVSNPVHNELCISVWDTGIGMDVTDMQRMYDPFVQFDNSSTRKYDGIGLGLALVKQLSDMLDVAIDVKTSIGSGTCFELTFSLVATRSDALFSAC